MKAKTVSKFNCLAQNLAKAIKKARINLCFKSGRFRRIELAYV